eukprot:TRINITY_DN31642_c0_g1_i1.p1 TRINITY_DN31642_c0_g1~~TRINITY_DN31642_c0_g1_i1.p1  ORF type:complete len:1242 (-),score=294.76 TRINITY_DN31642_c0_g1_i1:54-3779(-)
MRAGQLVVLLSAAQLCLGIRSTVDAESLRALYTARSSKSAGASGDALGSISRALDVTRGKSSLSHAALRAAEASGLARAAVDAGAAVAGAAESGSSKPLVFFIVLVLLLIGLAAGRHYLRQLEVEAKSPKKKASPEDEKSKARPEEGVSCGAAAPAAAAKTAGAASGSLSGPAAPAAVVDEAALSPARIVEPELPTGGADAARETVPAEPAAVQAAEAVASLADAAGEARTGSATAASLVAQTAAIPPAAPASRGATAVVPAASVAPTARAAVAEPLPCNATEWMGSGAGSLGTAGNEAINSNQSTFSNALAAGESEASNHAAVLESPGRAELTTNEITGQAQDISYGARVVQVEPLSGSQEDSAASQPTGLVVREMVQQASVSAAPDAKHKQAILAASEVAVASSLVGMADVIRGEAEPSVAQQLPDSDGFVAEETARASIVKQKRSKCSGNMPAAVPKDAEREQDGQLDGISEVEATGGAAALTMPADGASGSSRLGNADSTEPSSAISVAQSGSDARVPPGMGIPSTSSAIDPAADTQAAALSTSSGVAPSTDSIGPEEGGTAPAERRTLESQFSTDALEPGASVDMPAATSSTARPSERPVLTSMFSADELEPVGSTDLGTPAENAATSADRRKLEVKFSTEALEEAAPDGNAAPAARRKLETKFSEAALEPDSAYLEEGDEDDDMEQPKAVTKLLSELSEIAEEDAVDSSRPAKGGPMQSKFSSEFTRHESLAQDQGLAEQAASGEASSSHTNSKAASDNEGDDPADQVAAGQTRQFGSLVGWQDSSGNPQAAGEGSSRQGGRLGSFLDDDLPEQPPVSSQETTQSVSRQPTVKEPEADYHPWSEMDGAVAGEASFRAATTSSGNGESCTETEAAKNRLDHFTELTNNATKNSEDDEPIPHDPRVFPKFNAKRMKGVRDGCFETDWALLKERLDLIHKKEESEVKSIGETLQNKYLWVLPLYRRLSTQDTVDGGKLPRHLSHFGVSARSALKLLSDDAREGVNLLDRRFTKPVADEIYKHANLSPPKEHNRLACSAEKRLSRYQFVDFLIRVAHAKFPNRSLQEAIETLFWRLAKLCDKYSGDVMNLWTIGCQDAVEDVYLSARPHLLNLFNIIATETEGAEKFVTLQDWSRLLAKTQIYTMYPSFHRHDCSYAFRLGVQQVADEYFHTSWQHMTFYEFQRGLGGMLFLTVWRAKGKCTPEELAELLKKYTEDTLFLYTNRLPKLPSLAPAASTQP